MKSLILLAAAVAGSACINASAAQIESDSPASIPAYDYQKVLDSFNEKYGTSYQIAPDNQLSEDDRNDFLSGMTENEFESYLYSLYQNEQSIYQNMPFYESEEHGEEIRSSATCVDDINSFGEIIKPLNT